MTKQELRKIYKEKRLQLSDTERTKLDDLLLIQLQTISLPFINTLLSYWPIAENNEPDTDLFTGYIEFKSPGISVTYPRTDFFLNEMLAISTNEETSFVKNEFNIYEPEEGDITDADEIDLILVPLLAFDKKGFRVGYGKGFYDRFLSQCRKDCLKIGFSYFEPADEITDTNEFDVSLSHCITPQAVYVF
jgi:5-formyltetrahydrofolate cyclo-ligase